MISSTQQSIPIAGVKDGVIILKTGGYRMILEVSAVNFSLKSEQEQNSLIFQYQSFLNSLHFPLEIVIRSKRLDLNPYLTKIKKASESSLNELIKMQIDDYVGFVGKLISIANIMKKSFYVIVPYDPISIKKINFLESFFAKTQSFDHVKITDTEFKSATSQLQERGNVVASGLANMGLHCFQLSTEEIIELFYQIYNPEESSKERVEDAVALSSEVIVSKSEAGAKSLNNTNAGFERAVDNAALVQAQQKQATQERIQEEAKGGERQMRQPEQPAVEEANVIEKPKEPIPQNIPPQDTINQTNTTSNQNG